MSVIVLRFCTVDTTPMTGFVVYDDLALNVTFAPLQDPIIEPLLAHVVILFDWVAPSPATE